MVTARFFPEMGGVETDTYEVSRRLVSQGFRVTVLTTDRSRLRPEQEMVEGAEIIRVPSSPRDRDYYVAPDIYKRILSTTADVMHVQGYHTFVPPVAMAAALRRRLPFVLTFHSGGHSSLLRNALRWPQHGLLAPLVRRAADRTGMAKLVTRAAVVVLLSDYEAHPVAVMEALALRRRVLVSDGSGLQELVDHDAVECVDRRAKPQQIAHAVMAQMARGPLQAVTALPSWEDCVKGLGTIYQKVLHCEAQSHQGLST